MNNIDTVGNKFLGSRNNSKKKSGPVIAAVTNCLAPHNECGGRYVDCTGKYSITCSCNCHKNTGKTEARKIGKGDIQ